MKRRLRRSSPSLAGILALVACAPVFPGRAQAAPCRDSRPIAASETLEVDGAHLTLLTRGSHCDAPAILWLHGGPGGAETPLFRLFDSALEEHFVVAYWDQRGAGRSYDPHADPAQLTIARHLADLDAVVDHLRARLGRQRIVLLGHSWGGALALLYARDHAAKIAAVVAVAPLVSGADAQEAQYAFAEAEARRRDDRKAQAELAEIGEPPFSASDELRVQSVVDRFGGYFHSRPSFFWALVRGFLHGYAAPWEVPRFIRANNVSLEAMHDEILALDLRRSVPSLEVPVVFLLGRYDHQVGSRIAADWLEQLPAPHKALVWFEHSAHNVPFEEPQAFVQAVVSELAAVGVTAPPPGGRSP